MIRVSIAVLSGAIAVAGVTAAMAGDSENCRSASAILKSDPTTAVSSCRRIAEKGEAWAQLQLAELYDYGDGVPQSYAEAAKWYRKAAEQGDPEAQYNLFAMYYFGQGVKRDVGQAVLWVRKAAEQNYSEAQRGLGLMYRDGREVPQNYAEALKWFKKAA